MLHTHEAKQFPGGIIASLSIPWGFVKGDDDLGGYHLVWTRDLVETVGGLVAAGAQQAARRVLRYLQITQEADGRWPQNMWLDYGLFMLARPVLIRRPATREQRARAQTIVEAYRRASLARMTLFNDKPYYFSPGGSAVVYVVRGRTAVAQGDPIGPEEDALATITGFKTYCADNDWLPAFHQTLSDYLAEYRAAGFKILCIGNGAIVYLNDFSMAGSSNKNPASLPAIALAISQASSGDNFIWDYLRDFLNINLSKSSKPARIKI